MTALAIVLYIAGMLTYYRQFVRHTGRVFPNPINLVTIMIWPAVEIGVLLYVLIDNYIFDRQLRS